MKIFEKGLSRLCSNSMRDRSRILWIYSLAQVRCTAAFPRTHPGIQ